MRTRRRPLRSRARSATSGTPSRRSSPRRASARPSGKHRTRMRRPSTRPSRPRRGRARSRTSPSGAACSRRLSSASIVTICAHRLASSSHSPICPVWNRPMSQAAQQAARRRRRPAGRPAAARASAPLGWCSRRMQTRGRVGWCSKRMQTRGREDVPWCSRTTSRRWHRRDRMKTAMAETLQ